MSKDRARPTFSLIRTIRKFFVSAFVVFTFVAYAVHERFGASAGAAGALVPTPTSAITQQVASAPQPSPTVLQVTRETPQTVPTLPPTAGPPTSAAAATLPATVAPPTPAAAATAPATIAPAVAASESQYKDGEYTGDSADAYYGEVKVKATIQAGKITDVQFLAYPNDRRTSIRINSVAVPDLTTEAIQAQSASVDIISGATLTSEAFVQSLQSALKAAKS